VVGKRGFINCWSKFAFAKLLNAVNCLKEFELWNEILFLWEKFRATLPSLQSFFFGLFC
jgi:hypothetical protein